MLKIEFPAANKALALAIGHALTAYGRDEAVGADITPLAAAQRALDVVEAQLKAERADAAVIVTQTTASDDEQTNDAPADGRKDQKGVMFNPTFCANAKEPFYSSGATLGQWKKARGVDQGAYDAWYASEFGKAQAEWRDKGADLSAANAAAAAFSGAAAAVPKAPATGGELMAWVSERQVAHTLTQPDIDAAWATSGFGVADLFGANAPAVIATIYGLLSAKAGA